MVSRTYNKFTPKRQLAFLRELAKGNTVRQAASVAGVSFMTAYDLRNRNEDFRRNWEIADEMGTQALEQHAVQLARDGLEEPILYRGRRVKEADGTNLVLRKYDTGSLWRLLGAKRPDVYRERGDLLDGVDLSRLTAEERGKAHGLVKELLGLLRGTRSDQPFVGSDTAANGAERRRAAQALLLGRETGGGLGNGAAPPGGGPGGSVPPSRPGGSQTH